MEYIVYNIKLSSGYQVNLPMREISLGCTPLIVTTTVFLFFTFKKNRGIPNAQKVCKMGVRCLYFVIHVDIKFACLSHHPKQK